VLRLHSGGMRGQEGTGKGRQRAPLTTLALARKAPAPCLLLDAQHTRSDGVLTVSFLVSLKNSVEKCSLIPEHN